MHRKQNISYNPFFLFPFLLWVVVGGLLLIVSNQHDLFFLINTHYNTYADFVMYYFTWMGEGVVIIGVLFLLMLIPALRNWWYFFLALCCNLIPFFIQQLLKSYYNAPRPRLQYGTTGMHYLPDWPELLHKSYPSGHSEGAFSFFCFLSLLLPPRYRAIGLLFFLLAFAVAYSRVYLTAHFFADVYAGSIIGGVTTTIIFSVMTKYKDLYPLEKGTSI